MTDFIQAAREKIAELEAQKGALSAQLTKLDSQILILRELIGEKPSALTIQKQSSVPPSGSIPREVSPEEEEFNNELYQEATAVLAGKGGGTDPELAKKLASKKFVPMPRTPHDYGKHVKIQSKSKGAGNMRKKLRGEAVEDDD